MIPVVAGIVAVAVVIALIVLMSKRRQPDGVATFQRQIDALSPQARRRVVDRVQEIDTPDPGSGPGSGPGPGEGGADGP